MFGRIVTIDGTEVFVSCLPTTPYSVICQRAAEMLAREEAEDWLAKRRDSSPTAPVGG